MTLRRRLTLMAVLAVVSTVAVASVVTWLVLRSELRGQIDEALSAQGQLLENAPLGLVGQRPELPTPSARLGPPGYAQIIRADGRVVTLGRAGKLPVDPRDRAVAAGRRGRFLSEREVGGEPVRVLTVPRPDGRAAIAIGRSLADTEDSLARMRLLLSGLVLASFVIATAASRLLTRTVTAPIARLTEAAEHVHATGRLDHRVQDDGSDEVARLAQRFNAMLERVEDSVDSQRRLVVDASHELRTPITSLRLNAEVLRKAADLPEHHRDAVADIVRHAEDLSLLVADLLELARGDDGPAHASEDLDLRELVRDCVDRARDHHPGVHFAADLHACPLRGDPARLARAVNNLLDNAAKYGGADGPVEVTVSTGGLTIRDHGPGVAPDERERVFERFHRGDQIRAQAGSGLGLAIARQVAQAHGMRLAFEDPDGAGAEVHLTVPAGNHGSGHAEAKNDVRGG